METTTTISIKLETKKRFNNSKNKRIRKELKQITADEELKTLLNKGECK